MSGYGLNQLNRERKKKDMNPSFLIVNKVKIQFIYGATTTSTVAVNVPVFVNPLGSVPRVAVKV
jgi:hypothetical protein